MKKPAAPEQVLSRRKALGRIGLFATAAYTVPAFATLSMAHASSGASDASDASDASEASGSSDASTPSAASPSDVERACGTEPLDASSAEGVTYAQCVIDNS